MTKYYFAPDLTDLQSETQQKQIKKLRPQLLKGGVLVTRHYQTNAYTYYEKYHLNGHVLNMYDYFAGNTSVKPRNLHIRLSGVFPLDTFNIVGVNNNESKVYYQNHLVAKVAIAPLTVQLIGTVTYLDPDGLIMSKDLYDRRGFLSSTQYFDPLGNLGHQIIYSHTDQPKIEIIVMKNHQTDKVENTSIKLLDYKGADYLFKSEDDLWNFFVNEIKEGN